MNNIKTDDDLRSALVQSFADSGMNMMMLPKQMKPVWIKRKK